MAINLPNPQKLSLGIGNGYKLSQKTRMSDTAYLLVFRHDMGDLNLKRAGNFSCDFLLLRQLFNAAFSILKNLHHFFAAIFQLQRGLIAAEHPGVFGGYFIDGLHGGTSC